MDITFSLADKEAAFIIACLAEHPIKVCGELHGRLKASYESQIAARAVPPPATPPAAE